MASAPSDADYAALAEFRYSLRKFLAFSEHRAAECGLTPQQHQALLAIRAATEQPTVGYVAERLMVKPHSATGLVDRLVALALVERLPAPSDKRKAVLGLTERGHAVLRQLSMAHLDEVRRLRPLLVELLQQISDASGSQR